VMTLHVSGVRRLLRPDQTCDGSQEPDQSPAG